MILTLPVPKSLDFLSMIDQTSKCLSIHDENQAEDSHIFTLLISHARSPPRSESNQSYTRTYQFGNDSFVFL